MVMAMPRIASRSAFATTCRRMNILLINHYAGSPAHGMEFRPYYLAREWVRAGTACRSSRRRSRMCAAASPMSGRAARDETIDGIAYRWLPTPAYAGNGVGRVLQHLGLPEPAVARSAAAGASNSGPTW